MLLTTDLERVSAQDETAAPVIERCLAISSENESGVAAYRNVRAIAYLIQDMSYHQLNNRDKAIAAFLEGLKTVNDGLPVVPNIGWWDTFISRALLDEAEKLINGK
jgi:hypothetical protein